MRYGLVSISAAIVLAVAFTSALAQTPGAGATPAARWCPEVPQTPPPPHFELHPGDWANIHKYCSSLSRANFPSDFAYYSAWRECANQCALAIDRWGESKNPPPKPKTVYQSTAKPQGPFQLPGGTTGYILPVPTSTATPDPSSAPESIQGSSDPGGPFAGGYFAGADLNALSDGQPPDVAADVSPTQNVEFVNTLGMYVSAKPALPIASPAPTPEATPSMNSFWCTGGSINGQTQSQCVNGALPSGYVLTDPQIGYDASLGRWIATTLLHFNSATRTSATPDYVYIAVSTRGDAGGPSDWTKWSVPFCTDNGNFPFADQPLLGWSGAGARDSWAWMWSALTAAAFIAGRTTWSSCRTRTSRPHPHPACQTRSSPRVSG
jgi:hypothetical protein